MGTVIDVMGVAAALFASALVVLPTVRVLQGRLPARQAMGLWIAAVGFALLASAALLLDRDTAPAAVVAGVITTVIGNFVQRRNSP